MSRKNVKLNHQSVVEALTVGEEVVDLYVGEHTKVRDDTIVRRELSYIGQKAAQISSKIAASITSEITEIDLLGIIQNIELARFSARKLVDFSGASQPIEQAALETQLKNVKVSGPYDIVLLKLVLLPLVARPIKGAYNVYFDVKEALAKYLAKQPVRFDANERYTLVYQRVVAGKVRLGVGCCDNDNFEMQRATNAITEVIGIADSVDKFSFFYTTVNGQSAQTNVYLVREKDLSNLLNDDQFKTLEKA